MNKTGTPETLQEAILYFSDPDRCHDYVVSRRWPDGVTCPTCKSPMVRYLKTQRRWKCAKDHPKRQFSAKVGTIFEDSPIPFQKWLPAMWMLANCKNGISSYDLHRALKVTQKTAWFMLQRIRLAMQDGGIILGGNGSPIEVDETERGSDVYSDGWNAYYGLQPPHYFHESVDHTAEEYVRGNVHVNGIENYWALLKRALKGTYISVEPFHLFRYLDEQAFRFNERKHKDGDGGRFEEVVQTVHGRRLTYKQLIGRDQPAGS